MDPKAKGNAVTDDAATNLGTVDYLHPTNSVAGQMLAVGAIGFGVVLAASPRPRLQNAIITLAVVTGASLAAHALIRLHVLNHPNWPLHDGLRMDG